MKKMDIRAPLVFIVRVSSLVFFFFVFACRVIDDPLGTDGEVPSDVEEDPGSDPGDPDGESPVAPPFVMITQTGDDSITVGGTSYALAESDAPVFWELRLPGGLWRDYHSASGALCPMRAEFDNGFPVLGDYAYRAVAEDDRGRVESPPVTIRVNERDFDESRVRRAPSVTLLFTSPVRSLISPDGRLAEVSPGGLVCLTAAVRDPDSVYIDGAEEGEVRVEWEVWSDNGPWREVAPSHTGYARDYLYDDVELESSSGWDELTFSGERAASGGMVYFIPPSFSRAGSRFYYRAMVSDGDNHILSDDRLEVSLTDSPHAFGYLLDDLDVYLYEAKNGSLSALASSDVPHWQAAASGGVGPYELSVYFRSSSESALVTPRSLFAHPAAARASGASYTPLRLSPVLPEPGDWRVNLALKDAQGAVTLLPAEREGGSPGAALRVSHFDEKLFEEQFFHSLCRLPAAALTGGDADLAGGYEDTDTGDGVTGRAGPSRLDFSPDGALLSMRVLTDVSEAPLSPPTRARAETNFETEYAGADGQGAARALLEDGVEMEGFASLFSVTGDRVRARLERTSFVFSRDGFDFRVSLRKELTVEYVKTGSGYTVSSDELMVGLEGTNYTLYPAEVYDLDTGEVLSGESRLEFR